MLSLSACVCVYFLQFMSQANMDSDRSGPVLVKIDMAGHFSASDRYKYIKDEAFGLAFILERLGLLPPDNCLPTIN